MDYTETLKNKLPSRLERNLIHLRLGIGAFSKAVNGQNDLELTQDMLDTFDNMLKIIKSNGGTAIVRFAYDDFKGTKNLILNHIKQLAPIFAKNQDAITYIELGFFGPWGEMHSSDICTTNNVNNAIDAMLENTPEKIKIGVRQPTILLEKGDKKYEIKTNIVRINNKIINLKKDNTTVNGKLPQTGEELRIMVSLIILFSILATYFYIKSIL